MGQLEKYGMMIDGFRGLASAWLEDEVEAGGAGDVCGRRG
jgi:hypothetical protein